MFNLNQHLHEQGAYQYNMYLVRPLNMAQGYESLEESLENTQKQGRQDFFSLHVCPEWRVYLGYQVHRPAARASCDAQRV